MSKIARLALFLSLILSAYACGDDDGTSDSGTEDSSVPDGDTPDTNLPDGDLPDGNLPDGDLPDTNLPDTSVPDGGGGESCAAAGLPSIRLDDVVSGLNFPIFAVAPPGDPDALVVVENGGRLVYVKGGSSNTFLNLSSGLAGGEEEGVLGLAFHPNYAANGRFFVHYTPTGPDRVVVREFSRASENTANPSHVAELVSIPNPEENHNGGQLAFGSDGFLYVGLGDGGGSGDGIRDGSHGPIGHGQNTQTLFGSILRLDVDNAGGGYAAAGNPFTGGDGLPQIWAYGLRNPWRFAFDSVTGHMYVGDVGQDEREEMTVIPAGTVGANLGWRAYEGTTVFDPGLTSRVSDHLEPAIEYSHFSSSEVMDNGCSITGGEVYRGSAIPALQGWYLYGDWCSSSIAAVRYCDGEVLEHVRVSSIPFGGEGLASFGVDGRGEMLIVYAREGAIRRVVR